MDCHQCGACCTEISMSSPIPGHPDGKPAGVRCKNLTLSNKCGLFGYSDRPAVCKSFQAEISICGKDRYEAVQGIRWYEKRTTPGV